MAMEREREREIDTICSLVQVGSEFIDEHVPRISRWFPLLNRFGMLGSGVKLTHISCAENIACAVRSFSLTDID